MKVCTNTPYHMTFHISCYFSSDFLFVNVITFALKNFDSYENKPLGLLIRILNYLSELSKLCSSYKMDNYCCTLTYFPLFLIKIAILRIQNNEHNNDNVAS